jgi:putative tryptophan/tyrosine transport system substrate-binding protein
MRRRDFITLVGGASAWPLAARAQQAVPVIGYLNSQSPETFMPFTASFRKGLGELGYTEGRDVAIEYRWARGQYEQLAPMANELVQRQVSVLVTTGGEPAALAAKAATSTIPHVFLIGNDPVRQGLVAAYNRPGGNSTGASLMTSAIESKRLGLLRALLPSGIRIALLSNPNYPDTEVRKRSLLEAALISGHEIFALSARDEREIGDAFKELAGQRVDAMLVMADPFFNSRRNQIVALAARAGTPAIYEWREYVTAGGLMSYGPELPELYRQVGRYAGRILKGEKPADMPILQPTRFVLVLNLAAAKALGLQVPDTLPARTRHTCRAR